MKRPINVAFETIGYAASLLLLVAARRNEALGESVAKIWGYWAWAFFLGLVLLITVRAVRKKAEEKVFVSVFTFGFVSGAFLWSLFVFNESRSEGLSLHAWVVVYVLLVGCVAGGVAMLCAYIARFVMRMIMGDGIRP